jgi:hypothetical protein
MRKHLWIGAAALALVGCKQADVTTGDVNGVNANGARFAAFDELINVGDIDADGAEDDAITILSFVASDDPEICAKLVADDTLAQVPDIQVALVFAIKAELDSAGGFLDGEVFTGGSGNFADVGILVRQGGVTIAETFGDGTATVTIVENAVGVALSAEASGTMITDFASDPAGTDINAAFAASIRNAEPCDGLVQ